MAVQLLRVCHSLTKEGTQILYGENYFLITFATSTASTYIDLLLLNANALRTMRRIGIVLLRSINRDDRCASAVYPFLALDMRFMHVPDVLLAFYRICEILGQNLEPRAVEIDFASRVGTVKAARRMLGALSHLSEIKEVTIDLGDISMPTAGSRRIQGLLNAFGNTVTSYNQDQSFPFERLPVELQSMVLSHTDLVVADNRQIWLASLIGGVSSIHTAASYSFGPKLKGREYCCRKCVCTSTIKHSWFDRNRQESPYPREWLYLDLFWRRALCRCKRGFKWSSTCSAGGGRASALFEVSRAMRSSAHQIWLSKNWFYMGPKCSSLGSSLERDRFQSWQIEALDPGILAHLHRVVISMIVPRIHEPSFDEWIFLLKSIAEHKASMGHEITFYFSYTLFCCRRVAETYIAPGYWSYWPAYEGPLKVFVARLKASAPISCFKSLTVRASIFGDFREGEDDTSTRQIQLS